MTLSEREAERDRLLEVDPRATLLAVIELAATALAALDDEAEGKFNLAVEGIAARGRDLSGLVSVW